MTYGIRSLKSEARNIQKENGVRYTTALGLAKEDRVYHAEEGFTELLKESSSRILDFLSGHSDFNKVEHLETVFGGLVGNLKADTPEKQLYVVERLDAALEKSFEVTDDEGVEYTDFDEFLSGYTQMVASLVDSVPVK